MKRLKENLRNKHILIIGAGIIGKFNAIELSELGFEVTVVDPLLKKNSSSAALGLLMGNIYQKRKGRSWNLRKESLELWPNWINFLQKFNKELNIEKPLIKVTSDEKKFESLKKFVSENANQGLEILEKDSIIIKSINKTFQSTNINGIVSHKDGRINPLSLLYTLDLCIKNKNINFIKDEIIKIEKLRNKWIATSSKDKKIQSDAIILCNSLNALNLIKHYPHKVQLKPVLGQAIEINTIGKEVDLLSLPKHFNIDGINMIPLSKNRVIIGSTDEYNDKPAKNLLEKLTETLENKPKWISEERIANKWFGIRSRPEGEASPIQKNLEGGLILCTGFYKNGFLLAPTCSRWVSRELQKYFL